MGKKQDDNLTAELLQMADQVKERKMSESAFRRKAKALLEANTVNTPSQNRKVINDLLNVAKAERAYSDSLDSLKRK